VLGDGRSTLDLVGPRFAVLRPAGDGADDWGSSEVIDKRR
jgi:hypothetical protein